MSQAGQDRPSVLRAARERTRAPANETYTGPTRKRQQEVRT
jgi:hypothetical protein